MTPRDAPARGLTEDQLAAAIVDTVVSALATPTKRIADLEALVRHLRDQVLELQAANAAREPLR